MDLSGIHLVPKAISSQDQVLMLLVKSKFCYKRLRSQVGTSKVFDISEVILLVFKIIVSKGTCRLQSVFQIAGCLTYKNI